LLFLPLLYHVREVLMMDEQMSPSRLLNAANEIDESVEVGGAGTLFVELQRGRVEVQSHDASEVRIRARARGWASWSFEFDLSVDGNDVALTGESFAWGIWPFGGLKVTVRVWVPRQYSIDVRTGGGRIELSDLKGRILATTSGSSIKLNCAEGLVALRTSGGSIQAERVEGNVRADTSGGGIKIERVSGEVHASTSGGGIEADRIGGRVVARTSGGSIRIRDAAAEVEAITSGGSVSASFVGEPSGRLETSGGSIETVLPRSATLLLDADTQGGRIEVDSAFRLEGEVDRQRVRAEINGGGAPLRLQTSGGSIRVRAR
jgi:hypothetical protein